MATECSREAIQQFLTERGGRVKHVDLIQHFRFIFPDDHQQKTAVRETFKSHVDSIAFVKVENGVRLVCLKKRYRPLVYCAAADDQVGSHVGGSGTSRLCAEPSPIPGEGMIPPADLHPLTSDDADRPEAVSRNEGAVESPQLSAGPLLRAPSAAGRTAQPHETLPGSGYGNDSEVTAPPVPCAHIPSEEIPEVKPLVSPCCAATEWPSSANSFEMGHRWSSNSGKTLSIERCPPMPASDVPRIAVTEASPLPDVADGSMFILPGRGPGLLSPGTPNDDRHTRKQCRPEPGGDAKTRAETEPVAPADGSRGSQDHRRTKRGLTLDDGGGEEGRVDSDGEGRATPRAGRRSSLDPATGRSPRERHPAGGRNVSFLSARRSDADSASLASSDADDDDDGGPAAVTLDPLEHEWMMCASDGEWERLLALLTGEPTLVLRRDFVTGFNCLHWAAKRGDPELLALAVNFARLRGVAVDVDARSAAGYTPLHLAAMHGHVEVVKLLVGAYDADVEVRDYGGRKAGQYLGEGAGVDIRDIIGARGGEAEADAADGREGARWSFLPHLRPLRLLGPGESDAGGRGDRLRAKPLRRMSSLGLVRPKLQRLRDRTSQIVHSASFRELGRSRPRSELIAGPDPAH